MNLQALLADPALPPIFAALPHARLVGGAVRDALAGLPVADLDMATPDPPGDTMAALEKAGLRVIPTGLAHGTVTAISADRPVEITTLRRDVETDGRHALVAWTDDWQADAARRDFTINALSLDRFGQLHDFFAGAADLAAGRVRFVGVAATRITEDYLRILRCVRFFARYGRGAPNQEAVAAIRAHVAGLATLSPERVWQELKRILAPATAAATVKLMAELGVLAAVLPEGAGVDRLTALEADGAPPDPLLRLAALLTGNADAAATRLRLSTAERDHLLALRTGPTPAPHATDADLRRLLAEEPAEILIDRTWLAALSGPDGTALRQRLATLPRPVFPLEGRDALALGAPPGPAIGAALREVRAWWAQNGCTADAAACNAALRRALSRVGALPALG